MKTSPIQPARVDFSDPVVPQSPEFGDVYHARGGAFAQARHVFLNGNGLPARWQGRARFVILETGFGLGNNFLATWAAWRDDPQRCERLVFISIEKHPLRLDDMLRAHAASAEPELARQLIEAWPPLTPNLHALDFEQGRVRLMLALGDARDWLKELVAEVDAFYLDGFAPERNPDIWDPYTLKRLARLAAPGSTAATWSSARNVRDALSAAGFVPKRAPGLGDKWHMCVARFTPRHEAQRPAGRMPQAPLAKHVLIIGAGLAGAACADALARAGLQCTVLDARSGPAQASSGNPAGLYHGTLNPQDGTHARFNRACALATQRRLATIDLPWHQHGLLRLETTRSLAEMQALIDAQHLPSDYVQALAPEAAAELSGLALRHPAWFYPGGGALPPPAYVQALLSVAQTRYDCVVAALRREGDQWLALDAQGAVLAQAEAVVLAGGHEAAKLLPALPLVRQRGQLTHAPGRGPRLPTAGLGYAIGDGAEGFWCGATSHDEDMEPQLQAEDQTRNLEQWRQLADRTLPDGLPLAGRVAWRLSTPDRLPLVGGLPDPAYDGRKDQPRLIPRLPGLVVCTAFGSRGIGWAALCGEVAAALLTGAPCPLEADLLDAIDPARFVNSGTQMPAAVRAVR
ncbi:MAG TPA: FAD-dependent 5-carboxymethylaminomethyl-2-thiouridine(34) oxidoreductase MnmC [Burkholderiaceae bacterium]|jgi:tRNA 5-methylaminomethyl-2-thiouridine biosynthesis bifunctional protein